jgi:hypothetical protein
LENGKVGVIIKARRCNMITGDGVFDGLLIIGAMLAVLWPLSIVGRAFDRWRMERSEAAFMKWVANKPTPPGYAHYHSSSNTPIPHLIEYYGANYRRETGKKPPKWPPLL